jgi:hypothetical protein
MMVTKFRLFSLIVVMMLAVPSARADVIVGGSAEVRYDAALLLGVTGLTPVWYYDASNGAKTATQAEILAPFAGGGAPLGPAATYSLNHEIILGSVTNPTGRSRQLTTADLNSNSPLATWSGAEQIGIDGVTVFTVGGGGLVTGDFSLTYSSALNRLSLFNNFQIPVEAFRVNVPTFQTNANGFTIEGDLLTGDFFPFNGIAADQKIGSFSLNVLTAVPEPSSLSLLALSSVSVLLIRRRR